MSTNEGRATGLGSWQAISAVIGIAGIGATFAGGFGGKEFAQSWTFAFVFWMCVTLGCLAMTIFHHAIRARWSLGVVRFWEAGSANLFTMALAFIVLFMGAKMVYPWADPAQVAASHVLQHKEKFLNNTAFLIRAVAYFVIWIGVWALLTRSSSKQDETGDGALASTRANIGAPSILLFVLTVTFAMTDWVMSLDAKWFSTIWGFLFIGGMVLTANAFAMAMAWLFKKNKPVGDCITPRLTRDLGNMMMTFSVFWAYMALSQFLIIYAGNLPEETTYYLNRLGTNWWNVSTFLVMGQFFLPFLLLLSGNNKRDPRRLFTIALWVLAVRVVDIYWIVMPFFYKDGVTGPAVWMAPAAFVGLGGIWFAVFLTRLGKHRLVPNHEHIYPQVMEHA